jgi:hypothetical protein
MTGPPSAPESSAAAGGVCNGEGAPGPRWLDALALLLAPLTVLAQGHRFGVGNQEFLLASIRRAIDPTFLVNDWFLSTPPHHPLLVGALAPLCAALGEAPALLAVHLATRWLLLAGAWRLVMALWPGRGWLAAGVMAALVFEPRLRVGGHYLQGGHWEPAFLGMALALWILAAAVRWREREGSGWRLGLLGGAGILAHLFICGPVFAVALVAAAWRARAWHVALQVGLVAAVVGAPSWVPAAAGFLAPAESPLSPTELIRVLQFRHPHHHQPWTWPASHLVAVVVLAVGTVMVLRRAGGRLVVPAALGGWFVVTSLAFAAAGWWGVVPLLAYMQPVRLLSLFLPLALAAIWMVAGTVDRRWWFCTGYGVMMLVLLRLPGALGVGIVGLTLAALSGRVGGNNAPTPPARLPRPRWLVAGGVAGLVMVAAMQASPALRAVAGVGRAEYWLAEVAPRDPERRALAEWVRANTAPTDVFAIPPAMTNFRLWEERAIVVDLKGVPYRNADLAEWAVRIGLGTNAQPTVRGEVPPEQDVSPWQLILLAEAHGARYVVVRGIVEDPRAVWRSRVYTVLDLRGH